MVSLVIQEDPEKKSEWNSNREDGFGRVCVFVSETATANGVKGVVQKDCSILPAETSATGYGDPHFKTWNGDQFDFHGGCELVLLQNPHFGNGLGMNIHIRTLIKGSWSYIGSGVLQIGDNTLEVAGGTGKISYWINGVEVADMETGDAALGDFPIHFHRINDHQSQTRVDLGNGNGISLETFKHFVRVNVKVKSPENFVGSAGLLGSYPMGKKVARDNKTILEDANEFGQEWQVLASEPQLFHTAGGVQHPLKCAMPDMSMNKESRRRLGASAITEEDAALACARVNESDRVACVFDVLATNDKEMAGSY